jgi:hypothetical protein
MRHPLFVARAVGLLTFTFISLTWQIHGNAADLKLPDPSPATPSAAKLVEQALQSELTGATDQRGVLLKQALELDPNYAPARWQSGYVKVDGQWLSQDEAASRAAADPNLATYCKRRDALIDTADNQRELARWCAKHKLSDQARIHWAKALEFDPQDAEALAGLGVEFYQGQLLTKPQMIEAKKRASERAKAIRQWQPKLVKWRKAIESGHPEDRHAALEGLRKFNELDALAALEATFGVDGDTNRSRELNKLLVETAGRLQQPEATQLLIRRAIVPESEKIRAIACDELKKRPMYVYLPQLVATVQSRSSWKFDYVVELLGEAAVLRSKMTREVDGIQYECSADSFIFSRNYYNTPKTIFGLTRGQIKDISASLSQEAAIAQEFQRDDDRRETEKSRALVALQRSTGFSRITTPEEWADKWTQISETYSSRQPETGPRDFRRQHFVAMKSVPSCFPAGTPVLTVTGPRQIETIKVGDQVLTQDIATAELVYKPVQATTLRPPAPLVRLNMEGQLLQATRGHWFWVVGQGWQMAKDLKPGDRLHAMQGATLVESIDQDPPAEAYNLVVSDNHNYFVGDSLILAHDNVTPEETPVSVPGLAAVKIADASKSGK